MIRAENLYGLLRHSGLASFTQEIAAMSKAKIGVSHLALIITYNATNFPRSVFIPSALRPPDFPTRERPRRQKVSMVAHCAGDPDDSYPTNLISRLLILFGLHAGSLIGCVQIRGRKTISFPSAFRSEKGAALAFQFPTPSAKTNAANTYYK